jgi:pimeloyl-ACP methyl ester carboxylesterase
VALGLVVVAGVALAQLAPFALFHPNRDAGAEARLAADERMERVTLGDGSTGWFVHLADSVAPLVIAFGGNGQCAARTVDGYDQLGYWPMLAGANLLVVDYPGYGTSPGRSSQDSIFVLATAAYDYAVARAEVDPTRIVVQGYSLGTGAATYLASQRPVAGVVLVAPFDTGISLYNSVLNVFHPPLTWLVTQRFDSARYAASVAVAPLIITSTSDELINHTLSEALAARFPHSPQFHLLDGLRHNDYFDDPQVRDLIGAYIGQATL